MDGRNSRSRGEHVRGFSSMTVSEILPTMHNNGLFDMLPEFSNVVHVLAVTLATWCSAERSFSALSRLKPRIPLQRPGATSCQ